MKKKRREPTNAVEGVSIKGRIYVEEVPQLTEATGAAAVAEGAEHSVAEAVTVTVTMIKLLSLRIKSWKSRNLPRGAAAVVATGAVVQGAVKVTVTAVQSRYKSQYK